MRRKNYAMKLNKLNANFHCYHVWFGGIWSVLAVKVKIYWSNCHARRRRRVSCEWVQIQFFTPHIQTETAIILINWNDHISFCQYLYDEIIWNVTVTQCYSLSGQILYTIPTDYRQSEMNTEKTQTVQNQRFTEKKRDGEHKIVCDAMWIDWIAARFNFAHISNSILSVTPSHPSARANI